ncbi:MAG: hypothetical protein V9E83_06300 [Baekduia sp.]
MTARSEIRRHGRLLAVAAALLLVLAAAAVAVTLSERDRAADRARERRSTAAVLRARVERIQAPHRGSEPELVPGAGSTPAARLEARAALVGRVEQAILRDARRRDRAGELDGPVRSVSCKALSGDSRTPTDDLDLSKPIGRYSCTARVRDVVAGSGRRVAVFGHAYVAALDFRTMTYVYCRNMPAQGERGVALVKVRLARACLAARGKPVGSGYASVPDPPLP